MTEKKQHGGAGRGQGRKPSTTTGETMKVRPVRMADDEWDKCKRLGGGGWLRTQVNNADEPSNDAGLKTLQQHFTDMMEEAIRESKWYRTAPAEHQKAVTIKIRGVEMRLYTDHLLTLKSRPALVAECECGGEVQRFSMLLDGAYPVATID